MRLVCLFGFSIIFFLIDVQNVEAKMALPQIRNAMKPFNKACLGKSGVSPEVLEATHEGKFPPDPALQCHHACLLGKMKVLTKDNKISMESILKQMDVMLIDDLVPPIKELTEKCLNEATSEEVCEMSWQFVKCYYETNPDLYFFP